MLNNSFLISGSICLFVTDQIFTLRIEDNSINDTWCFELPNENVKSPLFLVSIIFCILGQPVLRNFHFVLPVDASIDCR